MKYVTKIETYITLKVLDYFNMNVVIVELLIVKLFTV